MSNSFSFSFSFLEKEKEKEISYTFDIKKDIECIGYLIRMYHFG